MTRDDDMVLVRLPPDPRYLRVARLTASSLGADLDFDMDRLDELKLAVDELAAVLLGGAGQGDLELRFECTEDALTVRGRRLAAHPIALDPIAVELLDMVTDAYALSTEDDHHVFWLRKARGDDRVAH